MINFRETNPTRTCVMKYKNYKRYKSYLATDFSNKCGYTNCSDFWFGGSNNFHIDHFKPWKKNPGLKVEYSNLVYCCSYVNILKSDDDGPYIDPCNEDYNIHFGRHSNGAIIPITPQARYMYDKMKLYLDRYRIIWMLDQLDQLDHKIDKLESELANNKDERIEALHYEVLKKYRRYVNYLKG